MVPSGALAWAYCFISSGVAECLVCLRVSVSVYLFGAVSKTVPRISIPSHPIPSNLIRPTALEVEGLLRTALVVSRRLVVVPPVDDHPLLVLGRFTAGRLVQNGLGQLAEGLLDICV